MYKLLLCSKYLTRRVIAIFAMVGVMLCVAMMIVAISLLNGFLNKIEHAAKGLFADIVAESTSVDGMAYYDQFAAELAKKVPEVEATSPMIVSYGILRIPGQPHYRQPVQIAGIRLPERTKVTEFGKGLRFQEGLASPTFDPPRELLLKGIDADTKAIEKLYKQEETSHSPTSLDSQENLLARMNIAIGMHDDAKHALLSADSDAARIADLEAKIQAAMEKNPPPENLDDLQRELDRLQERCYESPADRVILGLGVSGLSFRTSSGQTVRYMVPGSKVTLYVFPLGRRATGSDSLSPNIVRLSVVDDCRTDVYSIDSEFIWMPFDTLQRLNNMDSLGTEDPPRCNQLHIKIRDAQQGEAYLQSICDKIHDVWLKFCKANPMAARSQVDFQTWRQRQRKLIQPMESQRTLIIAVIGIMWFVAFVLIMVIFYIIVSQKTKDIGVLKAVGASSGGVAGIFLTYGGLIGLCGAAFGSLIGWVFVRNINPIHDWLGRAFGYQFWRKENYLFESIPNEVEPMTVLIVVASAIFAGVLGALIPSIIAARMQPVEALRYE